MSELLRPKDNDPRAGTWTRWVNTKSPAFLAQLEADMLLAEEQLRSGAELRGILQKTAAKSIGKDMLSIRKKSALDLSVSDPALELLRQEP